MPKPVSTPHTLRRTSRRAPLCYGCQRTGCGWRRTGTIPLRRPPNKPGPYFPATAAGPAQGRRRGVGYPPQSAAVTLIQGCAGLPRTCATARPQLVKADTAFQANPLVKPTMHLAEALLRAGDGDRLASAGCPPNTAGRKRPRGCRGFFSPTHRLGVPGGSHAGMAETVSAFGCVRNFFRCTGNFHEKPRISGVIGRFDRAQRTEHRIPPWLADDLDWGIGSRDLFIFWTNVSFTHWG